MTGDLSAVIGGYRRALAMNTERLSKLAGDVVPVGTCVEPGAEAAGRAIRDADLPGGTIVVTVGRKGALLFAEGDTMFEPGDLVSALARPDDVMTLRRKLESDSLDPE